MLKFDVDSVMFSITKTNTTTKQLFKQLLPLVVLLIFSIAVSGLIARPTFQTQHQVGSSGWRLSESPTTAFQIKELPGATTEASFLAELEEQNEQNEDEVTTHFSTIVFLYSCFIDAHTSDLFGTFQSLGKTILPSISLFLLHGVIRL